MAAFALAGMIGPQLRDYAGTYELSYKGPCGTDCKGQAELVAEGQTLSWQGASGTCMPSLGEATRDAKNAHWFSTDADGVWVLTKPNAALKFYDGAESAAAKGAPKLTAMRRDGDDGPAAPPGGSTVEGTTIAGAKRRQAGGGPAADGFNTKTITQREQAQNEKREARGRYA